MNRTVISKFKASYFLLLMLITCSFASAQDKAPAYKLRVEWKPLQNNYEGKNQSLSSLSIINDSDIDLPPD